MMTLSRSTLLPAAIDFLSDRLMALEASAAQRLTALVQAFQAGQIEAADLRAALAGDRQPAPRGTKSTAVLELHGVLMPSASIFSMLGFGTSVRGFMQQLATAGADPDVKAIAVLVDSPGGSIRLLPEAAALMRQVRATKPVTAAVTGMAASAAYWIASNANAIEATPSAQVGSVGVLATRVSFAKQLEKDGVAVDVVSAGKHKAEGHEALPMSASERAHLQGQVDDAYGDFVADIAAGRHVSASSVRSGYGEGRLVSAKEGLTLGMIDRVATTEDTLGRAALTPADRIAALRVHRAELTAAAREPARRRLLRAELAVHRRALTAASRSVIGDR